MLGEVETEEVIQPSQIDKVVGEQPHQKNLGDEEIEAKGLPNMTKLTIPIPYPQCLKRENWISNSPNFLRCLRNST